MLDDRLDLVLRESAVPLLPEAGQIAVFGARAGAKLAGLPKDRVEIIQRHYPDHAAFKALGYTTRVAPLGPYALSLLVLPRAKAEARHALATLRPVTQGPILIDGQKTDGIDGFLKSLRPLCDLEATYAKAHGKIAIIAGGDFTDWMDQGAMVAGRVTGAGVFSADGIDPGSAALIAALPSALKGRAVDLGAGWGALAEAGLARGLEAIDLVEADHVALDAARANITDARARFHWTDARTFRPEAPAHHVLCNPPFHSGRKADPSLGQAFLENAARILLKHGTLWLVANRHLPYETVLDRVFSERQTLHLTAGYKIIRADRPRAPLKG